MTASITPCSTAAVPPTPAAPAAAQRDNAFSQLLNLSQDAAQSAAPASPSAPTPPSAPATNAAPDAGAAAKQAPAAAAPHQAGKAKTQKADQTDKTEPDEKSKAPASSDDSVARDAAASKVQAPGDAVDPALAQWLSGLHLPATPATPTPTPGSDKAAALLAGGEGATPAAGKASGRAGARALASDAAALTPTRADATAQAGSPTWPALDARGASDKSDPGLGDAAHAPAWQAVADSALAAFKPALAAGADTPAKQDLPAIAALGAAAQAGTALARAGESAPPVAISLATPVTAPDFAQALGVQISVLARGGVQRAELHLNPAEMGPVSVQIALDGKQAHVNFGADVAATRQLIENGLPELAASLRDAGFTLSGGGVHSQGSGQRDGHSPGGSAQASDARGGPSALGDATSAPRRIQARVAAGGVDLYA